MRSLNTVFMRGGTSKGCMFLKDTLPQNREEWDSIFLQVMGNPDPKQIDGMGGTVSSNNKIVIVWKSDRENVDVDYLVGQIIVGKSQVDYKSNCGNMTAAVGPFAIEEGLVKVVGSETVVRMYNCNTNKYINASCPCENGTFAQDGECHIAGVDGTAAEVKVNFLNPAGSKTGNLFPSNNRMDIYEIPGCGKFEVSLLDVSNPMVLVHAEDVGLKGTELPDEVNDNKAACDLLEKIRGTAACTMGFAKDLDDASENSPAVPKVGVFSSPKNFTDIAGDKVKLDDMDISVRVMSVFKCHKASPLTAACSISVAASMDGTVIAKKLGVVKNKKASIRIGHPSGIMTMYPDIDLNLEIPEVKGVAVSRTSRRIMDGNVYIRK
jgi:hypothetical protein